MSRHSVIVVGAGPVGLTLAYGLARAGVTVTVIESQASVSTQLRASTFHPPTLDMLEPWGITAELLAQGRITPTWQIRLHETGEHVTFDLSILKDDTAHPYRLQCEQAVLSRSLQARLLREPSARIWREAEVGDVGQSADRAWVEVRRDRSVERIDADFVVGCDGAHSVVRKAIGTDFEGSTYPDTTLLVTTHFNFAGLWPDLAGVNYIWQDEGTYSLLHLPGLWRVSLHPLANGPLEEEVRAERIVARLQSLFGAEHLFELQEIRPYRVHKRLASRWRAGRLFIAGDAAHLNNPKGGMGMNGGIHDAICLSQNLIEHFNGAAQTVLDNYERQRLPVVRDDIIGQADRNHARMQLRSLDERRAFLAQLQALIADRDRLYRHLRQTSMLDGLERARQLAAVPP
ncbi:MAG: FAD-dependent monooxygenase [Betaproteobacteria bacterium]|nr:FAD-dependent monooxygenase [Betaproteobacteria bacterium]